MTQTEPEGDFVIVNLPETGKVVTCEFDSQIYNKETLNPELVSDDEAIARELQEQINREYDKDIQRLEKLQNGTSKLNISYEKYRKYGNYNGYGNKSDDDYNYEDSDWNRFEEIDRTINSIPRCGYAITNNGDMVTKHDSNLNGQRNMKRLMNLPLNIKTGDGAASNIGISNRVLNGLRRYSQNEDHRKNMLRKEKYERHQKKLHKLPSLSLYGVDPYTKGIVQGMMQGDKPLIKELYGSIGEGKESIVYQGITRENPPRWCALKIYKVDDCDLKLYHQNLADDYRYKKRYNSRMTKRKIVCLWAEKERDNYVTLRNHGIPCPEVIALNRNVLVTTLVDSSRMYATKLQNCFIGTEAYQDAYLQTIDYMVKMFRNAFLVHADLSANNILWWGHSKCCIIDVSQAIELGHKLAFEYLKRDCGNIIEYFRGRRLKNIMTKQELFKHITDLDYYDEEGVESLHRTFKNNRK